jgi:hypothetical protein
MAGDKSPTLSSHVEVNAQWSATGEDVSWWKQRNLRKLYLMLPFLFLGSTTLGYDGSLLNGLQTMDSWQACE